MRFLLNSVCLTKHEQIFISAEMVLCVSALHASNYIHCDIKPENILVDASGHLKLTDFGSAVSIPPTATDLAYIERLVTLPYQAPEFLNFDGEYLNSAIDYWSLGCIMYEMVVHRTPFEPKSKDEREITNIINFEVILEHDDQRRRSSIDHWTLITSCLCVKEKRVKSFNMMRAQSYFANIDWDRVRDRFWKSSFKANLHSPTDTRCFDQECSYLEKYGSNRWLASFSTQDYLYPSVQQTIHIVSTMADTNRNVGIRPSNTKSKKRSKRDIRKSSIVSTIIDASDSFSNLSSIVKTKRRPKRDTRKTET